ncbi:hypothetical protein A4A49_51618 [Nicotiana attenuata]|uniref:Uncharacterized protein n=1 Tax=Nicotiana attenuata TaxID=49451 RepID=A0A1J6HXH4_NICAT|nr:hypothetical protein A4A49_51618 [Nicotiana attenuata]
MFTTLSDKNVSILNWQLQFDEMIILHLHRPLPWKATWHVSSTKIPCHPQLVVVEVQHLLQTLISCCCSSAGFYISLFSCFTILMVSPNSVVKLAIVIVLALKLLQVKGYFWLRREIRLDETLNLTPG